jgi:hypothetical protein
MLVDQTEIRVVTTTFENVCGPQDEPSPLALAKAPLIIASRRVGAMSEHMAAIVEPLSTGNLYTFLKRAHNDMRDPGIGDAIGDAAYVDTSSWTSHQNYYGVKREDGADYSLDDMHRGLGEAWDISEAHRKDFLASLRDANPNMKGAGPEKLNTGYINLTELNRLVSGMFTNLSNSASRDVYMGVMGQFNKEQLKDMIRTSRSSRRLTRKEKRMSEVQLRNRFLFRAGHAPKLKQTIMDTPLWLDMIAAEIAEQYHPGTLDTEGEQLTFYRKKSSPEEVPLNEIPPYFTKKFGNYNVVYHAEVTNTGVVYRKLEALPNNPQPALVSIVHWTEEGGTRQLQMDSILGHPLTERILMEQPLKEGWIPDSLAGLLSVLYFSDEARATLKKEVPTPHSKRPQRMGPLQAMVIGPMRRLQLSRDKILPALEVA